MNIALVGKKKTNASEKNTVILVITLQEKNIDKMIGKELKRMIRKLKFQVLKEKNTHQP